MVRIKIGRKIYEIDKHDLILDNGSCYQLVTHMDSLHPSPIISKKLFKELKAVGMVFTTEGLRIRAVKNYTANHVTYWKFNIPLMEKLGYGNEENV